MYKVKIKKGDIFSEDFADFIVNPSNTELFLGSGVSAAFRKNCPELAHILKNKRIKQGEVLLTPCPLNKFKYALHVAIMDYLSKNPFPTYEIIKKSLQNIEKIIKNYAPCKIVLPLMGTGVGGLDKEKVIKIYKEFFSRKVDFDCEVVIYGYKDEDYKLLKKIFKEGE